MNILTASMNQCQAREADDAVDVDHKSTAGEPVVSGAVPGVVVNEVRVQDVEDLLREILLIFDAAKQLPVGCGHSKVRALKEQQIY